MQYFSLNLETISPLAIRSDHAQTGAGSADYISGTALAGSLAAVYRLYHQQDSAQFEQLFLNGQVYYPDLYPATFGSEEMQEDKYCSYPGCSRPMDHFIGYYRRSEDDKLAKAEVEKRKRLQTHTGINRDTGTVQEGILYNRSVFQEHTRFWGLLKLPEHLVT